jgi:hypothetical protein
MITTILTVFAITASGLIFEDWVEEFRTADPEGGMQSHFLMAGTVLVGIWLFAGAIAWPIYWLTGVAA